MAEQKCADCKWVGGFISSCDKLGDVSKLRPNTGVLLRMLRFTSNPDTVQDPKCKYYERKPHVAELYDHDAVIEFVRKATTISPSRMKGGKRNDNLKE